MSSPKPKPLLIILVAFLTVAAGLTYWIYRDRVFPIPSKEAWLSQSLTREDIRDVLYPIVDVSPDTIEFDARTFVDRNSLKFLRKQIDVRYFEHMQSENIPLWGWDVQIKKPFPLNLRISYSKKIISLEFTSMEQYPRLATDRIFETVVQKMGKDYVYAGNQYNVPYQERQEIFFEKKIAQTDLLERATFSWKHGYLQKVETILLLPTSYANAANETMERQKNLHQFFNMLHYLLIGIVFLFLFRIHETQSLRWKQTLPLFVAYFIFNFFTILFSSDFHANTDHAIVDTLLKTVAGSIWVYLLMVSADFIGRTNSASKYSLTDIASPSFFGTSHFRKSLASGWILAVWQIVIVFMFYKIASLFHLYIPIKIPGEHSLHCTVEFFRYFSDSLSTSLYEEILYRLFFIYFFITIFGKNIPAIILSAIIWGFMHLSYQFEPYYIRGIELTVVGFLYGFVLIRYGILSVLVAHFLYNGWILSEYEYQSIAYFIGTNVLLLMMYAASHFFKRSDSAFHFEKHLLPKFNAKSEIQGERRNEGVRSYPLNWKYGIFVLIALVLILIWYPFQRMRSNPYPSHEKLVEISSTMISPYISKDKVWHVIYQRENADVQNLKNNLRNSNTPAQRKSTQMSSLSQYDNLWSVRYFTNQENRVFCEFDFSYDYELLKINCPDVDQKNIRTDLTFFDWVRLIKSPDENWTLINLEPHQGNKIFYNYRILRDGKDALQKTAYMVFKNQQLYYFKKDIGIANISADNAAPSKIPYEWWAIVLSIVSVLCLICVLYFLIETIHRSSARDKKAVIGSWVTLAMYILWNINAYKTYFVDVGIGQSAKDFLINRGLLVVGKSLIVGLVSYFLFYAFFHLPPKVFDQAPAPKDWNAILKRPIWKWRNAKASLFYSLLLLCIQVFLRFLVQMDSASSNLSLFRFDVNFLNHEYLFITFMGVVWKSLIFWLSVTVLVSSLERYVSRWVYLPILCCLVMVDILYSAGSLDSKLIELCSIYIMFYFVYNISKFDFAFYFWFIFLNSLLTFLPILVYPEYKMYAYQVLFIYIFVGTMMIYTLIRNRVKINAIQTHR